ncbi:MAG: filamentous hemagglutinin N-terminal domain-containing protein, partial [Gammaproteobacteria bacterium]|nr:filamentous hemagglutinin N-terminal domain-containing protein [Gammaproteobacteria bacterium]
MGTAALVLGVAAGLPAGHAGPQGGQVVGGSGSITTPDAATTVVQQNSARMAIDWRSFDVAAGERVRFQQPSASAAVLNRVFNQLPSQIYGSIEANGQVFIMNPRGVVFGPGAVVDVGALFASSLDIGVDDFMQG